MGAKAWRRVAGFLCLLLLFPMQKVWATEQGTDVFLKRSDAPKILSKTEDFVLEAGASAAIAIEAEGEELQYAWQRSSDGGATFGPVLGRQSRYIISAAEAVLNTPDTQAYHYRATVTDAYGRQITAVIAVLVKNSYHYDAIENVESGVAISGYLKENAYLSVVPVAEESVDYAELSRHIAPGCRPLFAYDVRLISLSRTRSSLAPWFGALEIRLRVGEAYEGQTLRVLRMNGDTVQVLSGEVSQGALSVEVEDLGLFLVEVPDETVRAISASAGPNGAISPEGVVFVRLGESQRFEIAAHPGYAIAQVYVDGQPQGKLSSYTFSNVLEKHEIYAQFEKRPAASERYIVRFDSRGGSAVAALSAVAADSLISAPALPQKKGYLFIGWFTDAECRFRWNFTQDRVNSDLTLYAGWRKIEMGSISDNPKTGDHMPPLWILAFLCAGAGWTALFLELKKRKMNTM